MASLQCLQPKRDTKAELNRRSQVCETLAGTGVRVAKVDIMQNLFLRFQLITQNVDGLHQRAGSRNVIELHGNITRTKCSEEGTVVSSWKDMINGPSGKLDGQVQPQIGVFASGNRTLDYYQCGGRITFCFSVHQWDYYSQ